MIFKRGRKTERKVFICLQTTKTANKEFLSVLSSSNFCSTDSHKAQRESPFLLWPSQARTVTFPVQKGTWTYDAEWPKQDKNIVSAVSYKVLRCPCKTRFPLIAKHIPCNYFLFPHQTFFQRGKGKQRLGSITIQPSGFQLGQYLRTLFNTLVHNTISEIFKKQPSLSSCL